MEPSPASMADRAASKRRRSIALASGIPVTSVKARVNCRTLRCASSARRSTDSLEQLGAEIATVPAGLGHRRELLAAFNGADGVFLMAPPVNPGEDLEFALGK